MGGAGGPGSRARAPGSQRAGAGEIGRALWRRLKRGGGGPGWLGGEPRGAARGWAKAPGGGLLLSGGLGGCSCPGDDGGLPFGEGGWAACSPASGHVNSWPRGMGLFPQPSAPESLGVCAGRRGELSG